MMPWGLPLSAAVWHPDAMTRLPLAVGSRLPRSAGPIPRLLVATVLAVSVVWSGAAVRPAPVAAVEPNFPSYDSGYHNLPEMIAEIRQAAINYPSLVQVRSIGKSYQLRDIMIAKISSDVAVDEGKPEVLIDALLHAREHLSTEQALAVLKWLTTGYGHDATVTRLVNTRVVWIIFAANPDGFRYDLTGSPFRAWRKNRQPNAGTTAIGTDLNRNFGYRWACCRGSSGSPSSILYRGRAPFSAPEAQVVRNFVASRVIDGVQRIKVHVTLHTNGQLILWPYSYTTRPLPPDMTSLDHAAFVAMANGMARLNGYRAEQSSALYISDGNEIDWMYGTYRIFSFTFELYPKELNTILGDFYPDDSHIGPETARNRSALLRLIDRASCPYADLASNYVRAYCGPMYDDFEINRGWRVNALGTDTATRGAWQVGIPQATADQGGAKQLANAVSGRSVAATGLAAGGSPSANSVHGGTTTLRGPAVTLPADPTQYGPLMFSYYFAHDAASTPADSFQVLVETPDGTRTEVFSVLGAPVNRNAVWQTASASLAAFAGQTIRIVLSATGGTNDLVEAGGGPDRVITALGVRRCLDGQAQRRASRPSHVR